MLDPFAGSGSTVAAAAAVGYSAIGVESNSDFYAQSLLSMPALAAL